MKVDALQRLIATNTIDAMVYVLEVLKVMKRENFTFEIIDAEQRNVMIRNFIMKNAAEFCANEIMDKVSGGFGR